MMSPEPTNYLIPSLISDNALKAERYQASSERGKEYLKQHQYQEAEAAFRESLNVFPDNITAKFHLATALVYVDKLDEALKLYQEVEAVNPRYHELNKNMGLLYTYLSDCDTAGSYYSKINETMSYCPRSRQADKLFESGRSSFSAGKYAEASQSFAKALELQPDYLEAKHNLASSYGALGKFSEALNLYLEIEQQQPDFEGLNAHLGLVYSYLKNCSEADKYYKKAKIQTYTCPRYLGLRIS